MMGAKYVEISPGSADSPNWRPEKCSKAKVPRHFPK